MDAHKTHDVNARRRVKQYGYELVNAITEGARYEDRSITSWIGNSEMSGMG